MIEHLSQTERKICPFRETNESEVYCTERCMLSIPCDDEPNGVTCSLTVLALNTIQKEA